MTTMLLTRTRPSDGAAARADLRAQIARLERDLAQYPPAGGARARPRPPRLLAIAALERARDDLVERLHRARLDAAERARREAAAAARLEDMLANPAAHPGERVRLSELGLPGCGAYEVKPRLGLLGALRGWWVVKLSSGCPLATAVPPACHGRVHWRATCPGPLRT
jgi:hypothetical protein